MRWQRSTNASTFVSSLPRYVTGSGTMNGANHCEGPYAMATFNNPLV